MCPWPLIMTLPRPPAECLKRPSGVVIVARLTQTKSYLVPRRVNSTPHFDSLVRFHFGPFPWMGFLVRFNSWP
jgi:hypothetical protein